MNRWIPSEYNPAEAPSRRFEPRSRLSRAADQFPAGTRRAGIEDESSLVVARRSGGPACRLPPAGVALGRAFGAPQVAPDGRKQRQTHSEVARAAYALRRLYSARRRSRATPDTADDSTLDYGAAGRQDLRDHAEILCRVSRVDLLMAGRRTLPQRCRETWDEELPDFLALMHSEGPGIERAHRLLPAVLWALPSLRATAKVAFPRAWQRLVGWRRLVPPHSRPPLPFEAAMLICHDLLIHEKQEEAFMIAVAFETYLRLSELEALTCQQVALPTAGARGAARFAAITIRAEELAVTSKTGQFDGCMLLDLKRQQWMVPILRDLKQRGGLGDPLWTRSRPQRYALKWRC